MIAEATRCPTCGRLFTPQYDSQRYDTIECRSWHRVEQHRDARNPVSDQLFRAAIEIGKPELPPGVGSLRRLHKQSGISESLLSYYIAGEHLDHPTADTVQRLRYLVRDQLGEELKWNGTPHEDFLKNDLAPAGAKRFRDKQFRKKHGRGNAKKAAKKLRGQKRPQVSATLRARWANPATRPVRPGFNPAAAAQYGRTLAAGVRAGYASMKRSLDHPPTPDERHAFMLNYSQKHNMPLDWVRRALELEQKRGGGRPKEVEWYAVIRKHTWRGHVRDWPAAFREIEVLEGRKLDSFDKENLKRNYRREQRLLKGPR